MHAGSTSKRGSSRVMHAHGCRADKRYLLHARVIMTRATCMSGPGYSSTSTRTIL
jgi:hypothetical protein